MALGVDPREVDVLRLLAQGCSNREIGEALFISPRTVNFHVTNLLAKLELDSRAAAAVFAVRHGHCPELNPLLADFSRRSPSTE